MLSLMIPPFDQNGNLPPGEYACSWAELEIRYGTTQQRINLIAGLYLALQNLQQAGCHTVWINGSLPESGDIV
jgi:hypothetical protein